MYYEPILHSGRPVGSLCLMCENAVPSARKGCSWSRHFEPIDGWDAIQLDFMGGKDITYCVLRCPQFLPDANARTDEDCFSGSNILLRLRNDDGTLYYFPERTL